MKLKHAHSSCTTHDQASFHTVPKYQIKVVLKGPEQLFGTRLCVFIFISLKKRRQSRERDSRLKYDEQKSMEEFFFKFFFLYFADHTPRLIIVIVSSVTDKKPSSTATSLWTVTATFLMCLRRPRPDMITCYRFGKMAVAPGSVAASIFRMLEHYQAIHSHLF